MVLSKIKARLGKKKRSSYLTIEQTRAVFSFLDKYTSSFCVLLFLIGTCWILLLPYDGYNKNTYVSENALLPGQVNVYYGYHDIKAAETYRDELHQIQDQNITVRASYVQEQLRKNGFAAVHQDFDTNKLSGMNTFAIYRTPRSDGKEALVLSAPWISRTGDQNTNGIAALLSLSKLFKRNVYWSKDIILLVTDQADAGTQAWLEAYHGIEQERTLSSLVMPRSGAIQGVVNLDFPGTNDYERLGLYFEGVNGQLPNLDLINTIRIVAETSARIPVTLHDNTGQSTDTDDPYWSGLSHMLHTMKYQAIGHSSSDAGQYLRYKIDAVTIHGIYGTTNLHALFGFHRIGILVESTFRSLNNLLEHFHQSFFFYLLPKPDRYVSIGVYMPPMIVYACCLVFQSLALFYLDPKSLQAEDQEIKKRKAVAAPAYSVYERPMGPAFAVLVIAFFTGMITLAILQPSVLDYFPGDSDFMKMQYQLVTMTAVVVTVIVGTSGWLKTSQQTTYDPRLLKCMCLALGATTIATVSLLNFSLAVATALTTILPYTLVRPTSSVAGKLVQCALLSLVSPLGLACVYALHNHASLIQAIMPLTWDYQLVHSWFLMYACMVYWPVNIAMHILVLGS
ncbi:Gaa1-domain-containing protein [Hesseltinella vesiculosa]|uniref:Gaa1-domain-containing protein n=1 Tax=Hesseltinella vesiculosa TaxID=101127 RepID=A0A1X2G8N6_9FUNG|nr:Gaa1-domain-containing protein [Hesseltinella vesiculosa]